MSNSTPSLLRVLALASVASLFPASLFAQAPAKTITGQAAFTDYTQEHPGVRRKITVADLPAPNEAESVDNGASMVPRPDDAWPQAPEGFKVELYARASRSRASSAPRPTAISSSPRASRRRSKSSAASAPTAKRKTIEIFATGLDQPFGIAFYPPGPNPQWVYVANTDSRRPLPLQDGDLEGHAAPRDDRPRTSRHGQLAAAATGPATSSSRTTASACSSPSAPPPTSTIPTPTPTRTTAPTSSNTPPTASSTKSTPSGIRNCVGLAINPTTGELWCSANERDAPGRQPRPRLHHPRPGRRLLRLALVLHRRPSGPAPRRQAPRAEGQGHRPRRAPPAALRLARDDLLRRQRSSPPSIHGDAFAAEHGSWNRAKRTGYKVIRVPMKDGKATGEYEDFLTGFVTPDGNVWGRPVGVAVAKDGSLFVTDDGTNSVWHVSYTGK